MDELGGACSNSAVLYEWQRKWRLTRVVKDLQKLISSAWNRQEYLAELETRMTKAVELKDFAKQLQQGGCMQFMACRVYVHVADLMFG